jgi:alpha-L-rhamnosidase
MAATVRALAAGGHDDLLWELLQQDDQPSYGYFLQPTTANPGGMTTIGETWTRSASKNHMILAQIDEWFHTSLAGIRPSGTRSVVIRPRPVGDLTSAKGSHRTAQGVVRSEWTRTEGAFRLAVEVPANTTAEVWVPAHAVRAPDRAEFLRVEGAHSVYRTGAGSFTFTATRVATNPPLRGR